MEAVGAVSTAKVNDVVGKKKRKRGHNVAAKESNAAADARPPITRPPVDKGKAKASKEALAPVPTEGFQVHEMRVTSQGKMTHYISFALTHLLKSDAIPLCLHTVPSTSPPAGTSFKPTAVEKLISVVEILKREYAKAVLAASSSSSEEQQPGESTEGDGVIEAVEAEGKKGKKKRKLEEKGKAAQTKRVPPVPSDAASLFVPDRQPRRLHQYTQFGALEVLFARASRPALRPVDGPTEPSQEDPEDAETLARHAAIVNGIVEKGRKRPRKIHTPYAKIYLAPRPIPAFADRKDLTHQQPPRQRKRKHGRRGSKTQDEEATEQPPVSAESAPTAAAEDLGEPVAEVQMDIAPV